MQQPINIVPSPAEPIPNGMRVQGRPQPAKRTSKIRRRLERGLNIHAQSQLLPPSWSLPAWFSDIALLLYGLSLLLTYIRFSYRGVEWYFMLFGFMWVILFFYLGKHWSSIWNPRCIHSSKLFEKHLFWGSFAIRVVYVVFSYYFYMGMRGDPFEFQAADSGGYAELAQDWARFFKEDRLWSELLRFSSGGVSDMGYPLFIFLFYVVFDPDLAVLIIRLIHSALGAYTAVLIYRLAHRSMDETTARLAAIFCALHPVLICYAGISLKEVLMTCLLTMFIERADKLLRNRNFAFGTILPVVLIGLSLFFFRTVLGMIAFMAVAFALLMMDSRIISKGRKIVIGSLVGLMLLFFASDRILQEINTIRNSDALGQQRTSLYARYGAGKKGGGNALAQYAGAAVFAPLIFTIPFPTMVIVNNQEDIRLIHGGNWVRNVMSGLVILAMVLLLLSGDWRQYTLPLAILLGYLVMLVFTEFAHSLRFHIPIIPFEMLFAAYAFTRIGYKHKNWYMYWCIFMTMTCIAWNWFKLAGRGMA